MTGNTVAVVTLPANALLNAPAFSKRTPVRAVAPAL